MVLETKIDSMATSSQSLALKNFMPSRIAIDVAVAGQHSAGVDAVLEQIIDWVIKVLGTEQFISAKEEFYWKTGKVFSEDPFYNERMEYFIDYFIFERPLQTQVAKFASLTPFDAYGRYEGKGERSFLLKGFKHSVFRVIKIQKESLMIKDLIADERVKVSIRENELLSGIYKKDIFQGFIYLFNDDYFLSRGLIFHVPDSERVIKKLSKKAKKSREFDAKKFLSRLARSQLRHKRHHNLPIKTAYSKEEFLT